MLTSFATLASHFTSSLQQAQQLEHTFDKARTQLLQAMSSHLHSAQRSLPASNPLQASLQQFVEAMQQTSQEWDAKVAGRRKGVEFRQGFEDSLLVFVSGKVKSGKSSLGNYIAWGHTDPTEALKSHTPPALRPHYQSHDNVDVVGGDSHKQAEHNREFRVGATEATSSIQSFSLPGLTWVDSPGLHSLKAENGNLAREYLDHADVIVYTMKSDAPGRASDLAEIRDLIRKDKKALLLLTGSDDTEEDINDQGDLVQRVVMKDMPRRIKQQDYVRGELSALPGAEQLEIVSVSSRYAQENAHDPAALLDSGIGTFCATLQEICQSEGVRLKQRVPMRNLHLFLQDCDKDLQPYQQLLTDFKPLLQKMQDHLQGQIAQHNREGHKQLKQFIDNFFDDLEPHRNDAAYVSTQLKSFNAPLQAQLRDIASARLQAITSDLSDALQSNITITYQDSALNQIPDFKIDVITEKIEASVKKSTKTRNSGIGSILGGIGGFLVGGPAGAAAGAAIGGALGSAVGDSASIQYRDVEIAVGDNLQDIRQRILDTYGQQLSQLLNEHCNSLWSEFERSIQTLLQQLTQAMAQFQSTLQHMLNQTQLSD